MSTVKSLNGMPAVPSGKAGIYQIRNVHNNKIYVGSAKNLNIRWNHHRHHLRHGDHFNKYLQRSWDKYGEDAFVFEILLICDPSMGLFYEQRFLDHWKPQYNICIEARSRLGIKVSKETRRKISAALRSRAPASEETREKLRQANLGRRHTDETKRKLRQMARDKNQKPPVRNRKLTNEEKAHISAGLRRAWARGDYDSRKPKNSTV